MNDILDVTIPIDKLTENKLDAFYISVVRSERSKQLKKSSEYRKSPKESKIKRFFRRILSR
ncbi:MAG: hypothetical protein ACXAC7_19960 [Candidatus Hodarchaeales archaeon]